MSVGATAVEDAGRARSHEQAIEDTIAAFRAAPDAAVPFYPEWRVRDLIVHVVETHTRGCLVLEHGGTERPTFDVDLSPDAPVDELADALRRTGARLRMAVEACPHPQVWTYGTDRTPRFWLRRMLMEATLHRWDAQSAVTEPRPPDRPVALDGVPEFLDFAVVRKLRETDSPLQGRVALEVDGRRWTLDMGARLVYEGADEDDRAASVAGTPEDTWLWLNRRVPIASAVHVDDPWGVVADFEEFIGRLGRPTAPRN